MARVTNVGILTASGLIAGEALMGLVEASFNFFEWSIPSWSDDPSYAVGAVVLAGLAILMVRNPLASAGSPDEPAPPTVMM